MCQGLAPVDDALEAIIVKEGQVGEAWKKTSAAIETQNKNNLAGTNKLAKSINDLATATKSMDKAVIGGAYAKYLKEIQNALGLTNKELVNYIQNARKAAQEAIFTAQTDKEIDELTLSIQAMNEQLDCLAKTEDQAGEIKPNHCADGSGRQKKN
jgi:predicted transcriptional regulator